MLSDEPGKKLAWVCTAELLTAILGKNTCEAMFHIGFSVEWLRNRLLDGTRHRLVVFPSLDCVQVTWNNLFALTRDNYGPEVAARLAPFEDALKGTPYEVIDPQHEIKRLADLPVDEKYAHPDFLTAERFLALPPAALNLFAARAFCYHALGCNLYFRGDGCNRDGQPEYMTVNRRIADIPGAVALELEVTAAQIEDAARAAGQVH